MTTSHKQHKKLKALALVTLGSLLAFESSSGVEGAKESTTPAAVTRKGQRGAMDPLQVMKQSLNLSDEQARNLEPVLKEQRDKINALRRETSLTRQQRMAKLREMQQGMDTKVKAHLTPEQAGKWQQIGQGRRGASGGQGPSAGSGDSLATGLQAQNAQQGLPNWRSRAPSPHQPSQQATLKSLHTK